MRRRIAVAELLGKTVESLSEQLEARCGGLRLIAAIDSFHLTQSQSSCRRVTDSVTQSAYPESCTPSFKPNSRRPERASSALACPASPSAGTLNVTLSLSPGVDTKRLRTLV